jgi:TetR/AcrR family fatty acid metabolism transcriptional regulator
MMHKYMQSPKRNNTHSTKKTSVQPSKVKLAKAMNKLLRNKDFNSITTAEISRVAGANEALIFRHFNDKRGLLHHVLHEYLLDFNADMRKDLKREKGALNKLSILIRNHISMYDSNRVFARILLLEVRNYPDYFESATYWLVKFYSKLITDIIADGVAEGEIRNDIPPESIRDLILGGIEHFCMAAVIFKHDISVVSAAEQLQKLIFSGIKK